MTVYERPRVAPGRAKLPPWPGGPALDRRPASSTPSRILPLPTFVGFMVGDGLGLARRLRAEMKVFNYMVTGTDVAEKAT